MTRRFRVHDVREVTDLRGIWDFTFLGDVDPDGINIFRIEFDDRMAVPGCFDATPGYAGQRGLTAYRTRVPVEGGRYRLLLDGAQHWCRVFVNGEQRRDHCGGFTQFAVDIPDAPAGTLEVVLLLDNRYDYQRCPLHLDYFDWYHYGGLARGVELHRLGDVWIDAVRIATENYAARRLSLVISYGAAEPARGVPLRVGFDGARLIDESVSLPGTSGELRRELTVPDAALWSPQVPALHFVHLVLGEDDLRERIGLRQVRAEGRHILINDEPAPLLGVCRHESHPQFGHALPEQLLLSDAQLLKHLGCTFVRGSHYPQDPLWLDLCDELGLCVWSEAIGWQHGPKHLTDPHFMAAQLMNAEEMVAQSANHPSVILWGFLNESASDRPDCRPAYAALAQRLRELDPTRLVTYASCRQFEDVCFDLADVISVNCYPGWYEGGLDSIPAYLDRVFAHVDAQFPDKPLIISEIGAAALWGWRDWHAAQYSEQYQADLLDRVIHHLFHVRDRACGLAIWQFCDVRASDRQDRMLGRPRGFNNKGLVDEYRRPKLAYALVRQRYHELE